MPKPGGGEVVGGILGIDGGSPVMMPFRNVLPKLPRNEDLVEEYANMYGMLKRKLTFTRTPDRCSAVVAETFKTREARLFQLCENCPDALMQAHITCNTAKTL